MLKVKILSFLLIVLCHCGILGQETKPNILLITLDDMNWDSPGIFGGTVPNITPNIDDLADKGMRFEKAFVQAPNCSPSRSVIQTGLYPHQSGVRGFYYVKPGGNTLPEIMKANGYITAVLNKTSDSSLSPDLERYWDKSYSFTEEEKRSATSYSKKFKSFLNDAKIKKKAFYCVINIADPHKPFFNDTQSKQNGFDNFKPSKIYALKDVEIPPTLPNLPEIKQEVLNYFNSVKRGDDCVGIILKALKESGFDENTVVIFLSDHGMPFPFAKSSVYLNGIKTPLIVSWPAKIKELSIDNTNMVSAIDIAPSILDLTGISIPKKMEGKSFYPFLLDKKGHSNDFVFAQFDENAGGIPRPSRTVISNQYGYIFNPWATGKFAFKSAAQYHITYNIMKKISSFDKKVSTRFEHWVYRTVEELYDYKKDPNALNNLIDNPEYKAIANQLRNELKSNMIKTNDYVLQAFQIKANKADLNQWMENQINEANERMKTLKWKRPINKNGSTKNNEKLFVVKLE